MGRKCNHNWEYVTRGRRTFKEKCSKCEKFRRIAIDDLE